MGKAEVKYNDEIKEQVKQMIVINEPCTVISKKLGINESTIRTWKQRWEEDGSLLELRQIKKREFDEKFIKLGEEIIERASKKALAEIDKCHPSQAATIAAIYLDKIRLLNGESTGNISHNGLNIIIGNQIINKEESK